MKRNAVAGPAVIVVAALVVLHDFAFGGKISSQHPDVLGFWLPTYCFLGKSLAAGHVPAWNPHVMAGVPFAADPQSGWMYLPAMALFAALPCHIAIRWIVILQPIIGGLGLYAFLRSEGVSRPAATLGGLGLAMPLASSRLGLFLPFPSSLAWTAVLLAACSRYFHAEKGPRQLLWLSLVALAWGQLAAAYFAHGLIIGTGALVFYVVARLRSERRSEDAPHDSRRAAALMIPAILGVNAAFLLPRLAYLPRTSFAQGGTAFTQSFGLPPMWPLKLAESPGAYLGAALLLLTFIAFQSRRHRHLVLAFAAFGAISYVAGLDVVARSLSNVLHSVPVLRLYTHYPGRFGLGLLLVLPILGAFGMEAWKDRGRPLDLILASVAVALLWVGIPVLVDVSVSGFMLLGLAAAVMVPLLLRARRRRGLLAVVPVVAAIELVINGVSGLSPNGFLGFGFLQSRDQTATETGADRLGTIQAGWLVPLRHANLNSAAYARPGILASDLRAAGTGRYVSLAAEVATGRGYLTALTQDNWPLLASQRATLFGLEDIQGYNPVQLARYWRFTRAVGPPELDYNAAVFPDPSPVARDLLQVDFVIGPADAPPLGGLRQLAREGEWALYVVPNVRRRASVVPSWRVIPNTDDARRSVTRAAFNPGRQAVLEQDPGLGPSAPLARGPTGSAVYQSAGPQAATITADSPSRAIVLIRTSFDPNWHASVDGKPAAILPTDYVVQGVAIPAGHHRIALSYEDPWIGYGLLISAVALVFLIVAAGVLRGQPVSRRST